MTAKCPGCGHKVFEVYFEDGMTAWRCTYCHRLWPGTEYEERDGELVRKKKKKKE